MSLDAIGIVSKDISKSVEFYAILGIELKEAGGTEHYEGTTDSGVRLMVDTVNLMKQVDPDWVQPTGDGIVLCFLQESASVVNDVYAKIAASGFETVKEPWDAFWGQRYSCVKDPDGNQIAKFSSIK